MESVLERLDVIDAKLEYILKIMKKREDLLDRSKSTINSIQDMLGSSSNFISEILQIEEEYPAIEGGNPFE